MTTSERTFEPTQGNDEPSDQRRTRQAGAALAAFGLAVAAAGPAMVIAADPEATPFVLPFLLAPLVGAALAWLFRTWSKVLAVALGAGLLASTLGGPAGEGLAYPGSFFDFVPGVMFAVGGTTAIVGGVLALLGRRQPRPWIAGRERAGALVALAFLGVVAVFSAIVTAAGGSTLTPGQLADADATVTMVDSAFDPADLRLRPGETAQIALVNDGRFVHTFTSDELGVDETVVPGDSVLVDVTAPQAGATVQFWCTPHSGRTPGGSYQGMVGELSAGT